MSREEQDRKMEQIIAKAWSDDVYKEKLLSEPAATLRGEGIELPAGVELKIVENTPQVTYMVLPLKASKDELSDEALDKIAGGTSVDTDEVQVRIDLQEGSISATIFRANTLLST
ncbi:MAG: NHLP leader peptide family RiPP precursor [Proteobacteria bacterium]|nr:NHLP leader peptide family RiPP precursor [Pseudomonadota bacterium]